MRISDWSSDVCSSDLPQRRPLQFQFGLLGKRAGLLDKDIASLCRSCAQSDAVQPFEKNPRSDGIRGSGRANGAEATPPEMVEIVGHRLPPSPVIAFLLRPFAPVAVRELPTPTPPPQ